MLLRPRQQAGVPVAEGTWHNPILQPLRCAVSLSGGFTGVTQVARCWSKARPWRLSCFRVISSYKYLAAHQVHAPWLWPRRSPQTLRVNVDQGSRIVLTLGLTPALWPLGTLFNHVLIDGYLSTDKTVMDKTIRAAISSQRDAAPREFSSLPPCCGGSQCKMLFTYRPALNRRLSGKMRLRKPFLFLLFFQESLLA